MSATSNYQRAIDQGQVVLVNQTSPLQMRAKVGSKIVDGKRKDVVAPLYQTVSSGVSRSYYTISLSPAPATSFFSGTNTYQFTLLPNTISDLVRSVRLSLQYQATSNSVTISPPNMGLLRLEIYSGQNELLQTCYGTALMILWNLYLTRWEYEQIASQSLGLMNNWSPNTSALSLSTNAYQNFSLPLIGTFLDQGGIHFEKIKDSLLWKFYSQNLVSSGSGTLNLQSSSLAFDCNIDSDMYRKQVDNLYDNNIVKTSYLDCVNISQSVSLSASTQTRISLQNLQYKVPFGVLHKVNIKLHQQQHEQLCQLGLNN